METAHAANFALSVDIKAREIALQLPVVKHHDYPKLVLWPLKLKAFDINHNVMIVTPGHLL